MLSKKIRTYLLTALLATGIISFSPLATFAHGHHHFIEGYEELDDETKAKVDDILKTLKNDLKEIGVDVHHKHHEMFKNLDDETKEKVKEIFKQVKEGTLSKDEAEAQLSELGISKPEPKKQELDAETKEKAKELIEKAKADFEELGVNFPSDKFKHIIE